MLSKFSIGKKIAAARFATIGVRLTQPIRDKKSHVVEIFLPELATLCMLVLMTSEFFCFFYKRCLSYHEILLVQVAVVSVKARSFPRQKTHKSKLAKQYGRKQAK